MPVACSLYNLCVFLMPSSWPVLHYGVDAVYGVITLTPLQTGDCLDHYRLEALVARSGMASIFRATDLHTGRQFAIKVPHPEAECDVAFFERFQREARICREMDHAGVVKAMNQESQSRVYMVLEWVEGRLLREVLAEEGPLPPERATGSRWPSAARSATFMLAESYTGI